MSNYYLIIYIQYGIKVPAAPAPVGNQVMNLSMCPLCTTETCRNKANLVKIHDSFKTSVMSHPLIKICKMCKKQTPEICLAYVSLRKTVIMISLSPAGTLSSAQTYPSTFIYRVAHGRWKEQQPDALFGKQSEH